MALGYELRHAPEESDTFEVGTRLQAEGLCLPRVSDAVALVAGLHGLVSIGAIGVAWGRLGGEAGSKKW